LMGIAMFECPARYTGYVTICILPLNCYDKKYVSGLDRVGIMIATIRRSLATLRAGLAFFGQLRFSFESRVAQSLVVFGKITGAITYSVVEFGFQIADKVKKEAYMKWAAFIECTVKTTSAIQVWAKTNVNELLEKTEIALEKVKQQLINFGTINADAVVASYKALTLAIKNASPNTVPTVTRSITDVVGKIAELRAAILIEAAETFKAVEGVLEEKYELILDTIEAVMTSISRVLSAGSAQVDAVKAAVFQFSADSQAQVKIYIESAIEAAKDLGQEVVANVRKASDKVKERFQETVTAIKGAAKTVARSYNSVLQSLVDFCASVIQEIDGLKKDARNQVKEKIRSIQTSLNEISDTTKERLSAVLDTCIQLCKDIFMLITSGKSDNVVEEDNEGTADDEIKETKKLIETLTGGVLDALGSGRADRGKGGKGHFPFVGQ